MRASSIAFVAACLAVSGAAQAQPWRGYGYGYDYGHRWYGRPYVGVPYRYPWRYAYLPPPRPFYALPPVAVVPPPAVVVAPPPPVYVLPPLIAEPPRVRAPVVRRAAKRPVQPAAVPCVCTAPQTAPAPAAAPAPPPTQQLGAPPNNLYPPERQP